MSWTIRKLTGPRRPQRYQLSNPQTGNEVVLSCWTEGCCGLNSLENLWWLPETEERIDEFFAYLRTAPAVAIGEAWPALDITCTPTKGQVEANPLFYARPEVQLLKVFPNRAHGPEILHHYMIQL